MTFFLRWFIKRFIIYQGRADILVYMYPPLYHFDYSIIV